LTYLFVYLLASLLA